MALSAVAPMCGVKAKCLSQKDPDSTWGHWADLQEEKEAFHPGKSFCKVAEL